MGIKKISDLMLERYLLNELPLKDKNELDLMLENDLNLKERLNVLQESDSKFFKDYPADEIITSIKNKVDLNKTGKKINFNFFPWLGPVLAAALVVLFVFILPVNKEPQNRIKGEITGQIQTEPRIFVFRKMAGRIEELRNRSVACEGELLQIGYLVKQQKHGIIFSIDGNGVMTRHFPEEEGQDTILMQDKRHFLNQSYELDDAPDFERFYFVSSTKKIDIKELFAKIDKREFKKEGIIAFKKYNPDLTVSTILIIKGEKK